MLTLAQACRALNEGARLRCLGTEEEVTLLEDGVVSLNFARLQPEQFIRQYKDECFSQIPVRPLHDEEFD